MAKCQFTVGNFVKLPVAVSPTIKTASCRKKCAAPALGCILLHTFGPKFGLFWDGVCGVPRGNTEKSASATVSQRILKSVQIDGEKAPANLHTLHTFFGLWPKKTETRTQATKSMHKKQKVCKRRAHLRGHPSSSGKRPVV